MMRAAQGALLALALGTGACVPPVAHVPRVEPGARYTLSAGVTHVPGLQGEEVFAAPAIYVGGSRGWVSDDGGAAASLGAQVPILAVPFVLLGGDFELEQLASLFMLDAYVQPRRTAADAIGYGIGTLLSTGVVAPYVQLGRSDDGGIYTTQMIAWTYRALNPVLYWTPAIARRAMRPDGSRAVDAFMSATFGWPQAKHRSGEVEWAVTAGVIVEFRRRQ